MTRKTLLGLLVAASIGAALPAGAGAATVSQDSSGGLTYQASDGEKNGLSIQLSYEGELVLFDRTDVKITSFPDSCKPGYYDSQISCQVPPSLTLNLGDGDDWASPSSEFPGTSIALRIAGGAGDDQLANGLNQFPVTYDGGPGNDAIDGGKGDDTLTGGDGNDKIDGAQGADHLDAGAGDDTLTGDGFVSSTMPDVIEGGAGRDKIESDWSQDAEAKDPINVTLGGGADDGRPGEGDDVHGVESIHVNVPGSYTGSDADEEVVVRQILTSSTLRGMGGNDILKAADGSDELDGGAGADFLDGGFGDDHLVGGPGADIIHGDIPGGDCGPVWCKYPFGNDRIDARDGEVDSIDCGAGDDSVTADANDVVAPDCENVARGGGPSPDPQPSPQGAGCVVPKVKNLKLAAAKKKLRKAGCKQVKVRKAKDRKVRKGRVIKATQRRGVVTVVVSRGRR
jgi:Ca2+-binding RTX toxin-like protein